MSVNAVSGTTLRQDLVSALKQARAASIQPIDASGYSTASQDTGTSQDTGSTTQTTSATTGPALSSDLMASLLQLQSDFSQMGLQTGVTAPADSNDPSAASGATDAGQTDSGTVPVHHHGHHHARLPVTDAAGDAQAEPPTTAGDASAASTGTSSGTEASDGLQSLFQQMTKAIAAYATAGPVGLAAAALTGPSKA